MTHIDPRLTRIASMLRPGFLAPAIFQLGEPPQPARARELESLGAVSRYTGRFVPQIHADIPIDGLPRFERSGVPAILRYDEPVYAFAETVQKPVNPLRSTKEEIDARINQRVQSTTPAPKPNPHYRSYLGAQGPMLVPMGAKEFTLDDVRKFHRSDVIFDQGHTGRGIKVAVLDTGADPAHPMLEGRIVKALSFVPEEPGTDKNGHGSWTSSCVAGKRIEYQGRIAELRGKELQGMSEADIIDIKCLTGEGSGAVSGIVQSVEAAVLEGANLISMSLGSLFDGGGLTPDSQAVDEAVRRGVPAVCAVGNQFSWAAVGSPASARAAVAVGSCAMQNPAPGAVSSFSSKGPSRTGSIRPSLVAAGGQLGPNMDETILGASSGVIATESSEAWALLRGSSMSTPAVAGVFAQLFNAGFPKDRQRIEEVIAMGTRRAVPRPLGGGHGAVKDNRTGWGVLDGVRMLEALGRPAPPGVRLAGAVHGARTRPFLALVSNFMQSLQTQSNRTEQLRLGLV